MYLELEEIRLARLLSEWIEFEKSRAPFTVEQTEAQRTVTIAGLSMNLRLDRVDRLVDGSPLVVDYKTGSVDPRSWDLPRPDDLQLPLYKVFGLEPSATIPVRQLRRSRPRRPGLRKGAGWRNLLRRPRC